MFRFEQDAFLQHPAKKPDFFHRKRPRSVTGHNRPEICAEIKMMATPVPERGLFQMVAQWRLAGAGGAQEQNGFKFHGSNWKSDGKIEDGGRRRAISKFKSPRPDPLPRSGWVRESAAVSSCAFANVRP